MIINATSERATLDLFGSIGGSWLDDFDERVIAEQLSQLPSGNPLTVRINSPGGSVFAALAIKRLLEARAAIAPVLIEVVGIAASAATLITCAAGVPVHMAEGSTMLIHPVRLASDSARTPEELREAAEGLEKIRLGIRDIYRARTGQTDEEIEALMGKESYLTADEAIAMHFADGKISAAQGVEAAAPDRVCAKAGETCAADLERIRAAVDAFAPAASAEELAPAVEAATPPENAEKAEDLPASASAEKIESRAPAAPPDNSAERVRAAIAAERARVAVIDELSDGLRGCDDLIRLAKSEGQAPGDFAMAVLRRIKGMSSVALAARAADAQELASLAVPSNDGVTGHEAADAVEARQQHLSRVAAEAAARLTRG